MNESLVIQVYVANDDEESVYRNVSSIAESLQPMQKFLSPHWFANDANSGKNYSSILSRKKLAEMSRHKPWPLNR